MQAEDAVDPRLIALGLVPPPAAAPPTPDASPVAPPAPAPGPVAAPAPAPMPVAKQQPPPAAPANRSAIDPRLAALIGSVDMTESAASAPGSRSLDRSGKKQRSEKKERPEKRVRVDKKQLAAEKKRAEEQQRAEKKLAEQQQRVDKKLAEEERRTHKKQRSQDKHREAKPLPAPKPRAEPRPPTPVAPVFVPSPDAKLVYVHSVAAGMRTMPLELWSDHVQLGKRMIGWESVRAVTARSGRVLIETRGEKTPLIVVPTVDGVEEPALAPVFAEIVLDASGGSPPRDKLTRALSDGKADTKYRFRERDDQSVPLLVILIAVLAAIVLAIVVPAFVVVPFRGGSAIGADTFLIYPRLSSLDPRALVAAIAGGMLLSRAIMRAAAGRDLILWARGAIAGWNPPSRLQARIARIVAAHALLHSREYAIAVAIAVVLFLPSGRERVLVDAEGVHIRAALPFFDRDVPWSNVAEPALIQQGGSYEVVLTAQDAGLVGGTLVDTRGSLFYGLSPYELAQFAERQRNRTP